jgi:hypothetical protein
MTRELPAFCHRIDLDGSKREEPAGRVLGKSALMSNFTKAGSEDWQSTLTRAPLFANLFLDRLAALRSRVVNAPFRNLCFVALFDHVVDCRLLAYVPPVDSPW